MYKINLWITNLQKRIKWKNVIIASILLSLIFIIFPRSQNLKIHFVDVGQGDCTLVVTSTGKTILIDGGGSENRDNYDVGSSVLVPYLLDRKISTIDYMIVSHFHADHCNGLLAVLEKLKVKNIIFALQEKTCKEYENFIQKAKQNKSKVHIAKDGQGISIDKTTKLEIIKAGIKSENLNNTSIIAKLVYGNFSMLLTGDAEIEEEQTVLSKNLKADVLKTGHHGSTTSTSIEFLQAVSPKIALIGVGEGNKFGHPKPETLQKLEQVKVYRTDLCGEITIEVNKKGQMKIKTMIGEFL